MIAVTLVHVEMGSQHHFVEPFTNFNAGEWVFDESAWPQLTEGAMVGDGMLVGVDRYESYVNQVYILNGTGYPSASLNVDQTYEWCACLCLCLRLRLCLFLCLCLCVCVCVCVSVSVCLCLCVCVFLARAMRDLPTIILSAIDRAGQGPLYRWTTRARHV